MGSASRYLCGLLQFSQSADFVILPATPNRDAIMWFIGGTQLRPISIVVRSPFSESIVDSSRVMFVVTFQFYGLSQITKATLFHAFSVVVVVATSQSLTR